MHIIVVRVYMPTCQKRLDDHLNSYIGHSLNTFGRQVYTHSVLNTVLLSARSMFSGLCYCKKHVYCDLQCGAKLTILATIT